MDVCRTRWQCGLKRRSAAIRLLGLRVPVPLRAWKFVPCHVACRAGSGLCDKLITRSEESYGACVCLIVRDIETSTIRRPRLDLDCCAKEKINL